MSAVTAGRVRSTTGAAPARRPGRPRDAGVDAAILAATLELGGEIGISAMSMDELARRAGVSKATIYRRWASKEELVLDALASSSRPFDDVDTGSLRGDLEAYLGELADRMTEGRTSDILPHLVGAAAHDEAVRDALDDFIQHRRKPLRSIVTRGVERGELGADTDVEVVLDAVLGAFVYRRLLTVRAMDDDFVESLVRIVLPDR